MPILNEDAKTIDVEVDLILWWIDPRLALPVVCRSIIESDSEWKQAPGLKVDTVKEIAWTPELAVSDNIRSRSNAPHSSDLCWILDNEQ